MKTWTDLGSRSALAFSPAIIRSIGSPAFGAVVIDALFDALRARHLAVYSDQTARPAQLWLSATTNAEAVTRQCWSIYSKGFVASDPTWSAVRRCISHEHELILGLQNPEDVASPEFREAAYRRYGIASRLSAYTHSTNGRIVALNIYRTSPDIAFGEGDVSLWTTMAPSLMAATLRHLELKTSSKMAASEYDGPIGRFCKELTASRCNLSAQEAAVCSRILVGYSYKEVARELNISLSSVKTYRERAFRRLDATSKPQVLCRIVDTVLSPRSIIGRLPNRPIVQGEPDRERGKRRSLHFRRSVG
jgi:DNA-binding CsgD family transcriptional regulator